MAGVFGHLRRLFSLQSPDDQSDSALLGRFVGQRDEAAFAKLLQRHGPLVLRVCQQVLEHPDDAEDAFQAAFLVLARQAGSIRQGESLPGWLYRVAYHIAVQARSRSVNRQVHEKQVAVMRPAESSEHNDWKDLWPIVHDEVNRLPAKYRSPLVLCYLNGMTNEEAADQLACPVGTVKTRLNRARDMLRDRLARRGVALAPVLLAGLLVPSTAKAGIPAALAETTVRAAGLVAAGQSIAGVGVSAEVSALAEGALKALFVSKVKAVAAAAVLMVGLGSTAAGLWWQHSPSSFPFAAPASANHPGAALPADSVSGLPVPAVLPGGVSLPAGHPGPFQAVTTVYPPVDTSITAGNIPSSRQDAHLNQDLPRSRQDQYNQYVEEVKRKKEAAKQAPELLPMPSVARPEFDRNSHGPRWWELIQFPW
jgi:RNA polymerase sigma factor (sigma-70 family)